MYFENSCLNVEINENGILKNIKNKINNYDFPVESNEISFLYKYDEKSEFIKKSLKFNKSSEKMEFFNDETDFFIVLKYTVLENCISYNIKIKNTLIRPV